MTVFQGAVDATFAAFGIDAVYTPAGGEPIPVGVIAKRPDTIVGFGETRIHAETATFEVRASEVASPRQGDQLTVDNETFVVQGEPERRDPDRLGWNMDAGIRERVLMSLVSSSADILTIAFWPRLCPFGISCIGALPVVSRREQVAALATLLQSLHSRAKLVCRSAPGR